MSRFKCLGPSANRHSGSSSSQPLKKRTDVHDEIALGQSRRARVDQHCAPLAVSSDGSSIKQVFRIKFSRHERQAVFGPHFRGKEARRYLVAEAAGQFVKREGDNVVKEEE
jgi:hypothetical protein